MSRALVLALCYALLVDPIAAVAAIASIHIVTSIVALFVLLPLNSLVVATVLPVVVATEAIIVLKRVVDRAYATCFYAILLYASLGAATYAFIVYSVLVNPPALPQLVSEAIRLIYRSPLVRFTTALLVLGIITLLVRSMAGFIVDILSPSGYARVAVGEYIAREYRLVLSLSTWYHKLLLASLSGLVALPAAVYTHAVITLIYSKLAMLAPRVDQATLEVVKNSLSIFVFWSIEWYVYRWVRGVMRLESRARRPIGNMLLIAIVAALLTLAAPTALYGLLPGVTPPASGLDESLARLLYEFGLTLEKSEEALRGLVAYLWGS